MTRRILKPVIDKTPLVQPVTRGGAEDIEPVGEAANIGLVTTDKLNVNNGIAVLDNNGSIDPNILPNELTPTYVPRIEGESELIAGNVYEFIITNYDSAVNYVITVSDGIGNRQEDTITYRAPLIEGVYNLVINGTIFELTVKENVITRPVISSPLNHSVNLPKSFDITSSDFSMLGSSEISQLSSRSYQGNLHLTASDAQTSDHFGVSVALDGTGSILVVGAYTEDTAATDAGKVYIYDWNGSSWVERNQITASDAQASDSFGISVALNDTGTILVVGAHSEDTAATNAGKVYIYDWNGSAWIERGTITASDAQAGDYFGRAVALNDLGDVIVVGATGEDTAATDAGKVYIYDWNGSAWIERGTITASDAQTNDYFGVSVALNSTGDILAVGAIGEDTAATDAGKVYIYDWNGSSWVERNQITASDAQASDQFGVSVALDGTGSILVVGAYYEDTAGTDAGKVYIYDWNGSAWIERNTLTASDPQVSDIFGISVALNDTGAILVVGALLEDTVANNAGKVYTYSIDNNEPPIIQNYMIVNEQGTLVASDAQASDSFGISTSMSGDGTILAVGAYLEDTAATDAGKVYIYDWNGSSWIERGTITASDAQVDDYFGFSVALDDTGTILAVGAHAEDTAAATGGKVYIYDWNGSAWIERGTIVASDAQTGDSFAASLALNNTGSILAVCSENEDTAAVNAGKVYIYDWNGSAWIERGTITASDAQASDIFGRSLAFNGNGDILVVGAYAEDTAATDAGKVYIYDWNGSVWIERGTITASDAQADDSFGVGIALDNTGTMLVVGANAEDTAGTDAGKVYIYEWNGAVWIERGTLTASDSQANDYFGGSVAISGNSSRVVVGAYGHDGVSTDSGKVYTYNLSYHASTDWELATDIDFTNIVQSSIGDVTNLESWKVLGLTEATDYYARVKHNSLSKGSSEWSLPMLYTTRATFMANNEVHKLLASDAQVGDFFGVSASMNIDGSILVVGAYGEDTAGTDAGKVYIYDWNGGAWIERGTLTASDAQADNHFGCSLALDGTGSILAVGAYNEDTAATDAGKVYIYDWNGSSWLERGTIVASDAQTSDQFGVYVALNDTGTILVVGAYTEDTAATDAGKVYIYDWNGSAWIERGTITASDAQAGDGFGVSLALDSTGTILVVGAYGEDTAGSNAGKVYIYDWNGTTWIERGTITASDAQAGDHFGISVALNDTGAILVVGALLEDTAGTDAGKVYIYDWNGSSWVERGTITASDVQAGDQFGRSVVLSRDGSKLCISGVSSDTAAINAGAVYTYM